MSIQIKLLLTLFIVILVALVFLLVFYFVLGANSRKGQVERKWTDPKFHD